jgi:hypothetical protein
MKKNRLFLYFLLFAGNVFSPLFAQGYIVNGDMQQWNAGEALPEGYSLSHPKQPQKADAVTFFAKDPLGYKGEMNALKMFRNSHNVADIRYFISPYAFLEEGTYILTFYLKGKGWIRSVNLATENGMASTATTSYEETYVWKLMGSDTDFINGAAGVDLQDWKKYTYKYTVKQGTYCLGIAHNNNLTTGITDTLRIAGISLKSYAAPQLSDIQIGGNTIHAFSPSVYTYSCKLPYENGDTDFPQITCTAGEGVDVSVTPASNLSGNESQRTAKLKVVNKDDNTDTAEYKIIFIRAGGAGNAQLDSLFINGQSIPGFEKSKNNYSFCLPYTTSLHPEIRVSTFAAQSTYTISPAGDIRGAESERTARIGVVSKDKSQNREYTVTFNVIPELDLILAIGQSNMAGRGKLDASKDMATIDGALLFDLDNQWEPASNPMNKYSGIKDLTKYQGMNPAYMVAKKITEVTGRNIGMIVNARGATSMESWQKESTDGYYASSVKRAKEAQKWGTFKAIIWHQGEANISRTAKYPAQLKQLVNDLRTDLNEPNLFFAAGQLSHWRTGGTGEATAIFNAMIDTISQFIPFSGTANAEGLQPIVTSGSNGLPDYNDPHFDRESQIIFGERYADILLEKVYGGNTSLHTMKNDDRSPLIYLRDNKICLTQAPDAKRDSVFRLTNLFGQHIMRTSFSGYIEIPVQTQGVYIVSIDNQVNVKIWVHL